MHVDDGLIVGKSRPAVLSFIENLKKHYTLKIKERLAQHLGYTFVWQNDQSLLVHQADFVNKILDEFGMSDANPVKSPSPLNFHQLVALDSPAFDVKTMQKAIGMLNYLALHSRPDIAFTVNVLARFTARPTMSHWSLIKHLMQYICGSKCVRIHFVPSGDKNLYGWADADYGSSLVTRKSISGYVITFCGNPISWTMKKQPIVAQSKTEAEFVAINKCAKQL
jgi:hypothetical protein